jgi:hypothetical protein
MYILTGITIAVLNYLESYNHFPILAASLARSRRRGQLRLWSNRLQASCSGLNVLYMPTVALRITLRLGHGLGHGLGHAEQR